MSLRTVISKMVLLPCSKVYGFITFVRNKMYDARILPQNEFDIPVLVVGNLAVGGTGKTPHVEYIVEALRLNYHIAIVSRGYKRSTRGFVLATPQSKPSDIGDEAYQMYHKFDCKITVAVCEDRTTAITELQQIDPDINLIVMDDAFQHRRVKPTVSVILTEYRHPVFRDKMLPYGRLREGLYALNRADMVVVTKSPDTMPDYDYRHFMRDLNLFPYQSLFFSRFAYQALVPLSPEQSTAVPSLEWMTAADSILAVAGVANPRPFVRYLKSFQPKVRVNVFGDHHNFSRRDMEMLRERFRTMKGSTKILVTTEKDAVRMKASPYFPPELRAHTFYLPIKVEFVNHNGLSFEQTLIKLIRDSKKLS